MHLQNGQLGAGLSAGGTGTPRCLVGGVGFEPPNWGIVPSTLNPL